MKGVLDVGNGCGPLTAPRLLRDLGCELTVLFEEPDGTFPGRGPDPTKEGAMEPLAAKVREIGAELGIGIGTVLTYRQRAYQKLGLSRASNLLSAIMT